MNILTIDNITKSFGDRPLFDRTSFYLQEGEKVGIIGINGTGKSTLLKMMAGLEEPDEGSITRANHVVCSYLPQHPLLQEKDTVIEENYLESSRFRATLFEPSDLLILDEPTNHLDHDMAQWLEEQLKSYTGAVVMVTHDRYFLDSVSNRIVEIDKGKIYSYQAGYAGFLELKAAREEAALASERKRKSILRKELEWVKRGARARTTKQKARLERYEELKSASAPAADGKPPWKMTISAKPIEIKC